jgi:membrane protein DedA with SNARE-associated domain
VDPGTLIATYGYWAVAAGCLLEGETVLALAGFAAHRGYLGLPEVIAAAALAAFAGDQFFFWLGRRHGAAVLRRWPSAAARAQRVHALIERHPRWMIIGTRFAYGLRIAGPILIGTSRLSAWRFAAFNAVGAALWATMVAVLGWSFGQLVEVVLGDIRRIEHWLLLALACIGAAAWWWRRRRTPR